MVKDMVRLTRYSLRIVITLSILAVMVLPMQPSFAGFEPPRYRINLNIADVSLDSKGNLYVIVNSWTSRERNLKRILPDRKLDEDFRLERLDECCTVDPFLVDTDAAGNIYIAKYRVQSDDFIVAKYTPDGDLDEEFAAGGILEYPFKNPADLAVRPDGFIYVLDREIPEVYVVSPDGAAVREQVLQHYTMLNPAKLKLGPANEIYIFDLFDREFTRYEIPQGIVKLNPDGTPVENYGMEWESINSGLDPLNYASFVVDVDGSLWVLGSYYEDAGPSSGAYHFDPDGYRIDGIPLEYRLSDEENAAAICADNESGFIIFEIDNLNLVAYRYSPKGKVIEKFSAEVFRQ